MILACSYLVCGYTDIDVIGNFPQSIPANLPQREFSNKKSNNF
jgi:hypothetical protein